MSDLTVFH